MSDIRELAVSFMNHDIAKSCGEPGQSEPRALRSIDPKRTRGREVHAVEHLHRELVMHDP